MTEEDIFLKALEKSPAERAPFLDKACDGQPTLRAALNALFAAHESKGNLLDRPMAAERIGAANRQTETVEHRPVIAAGAVIADRYSLVKKIGEGGMGEVWIARQTAPVKRKVAVKLIKTGMNSKAVLARFDAERQALALMDHPNIARVLDGGISAAGQPFFVMELVNGMPLSKFCDEAQLTLRERLELFVPICHAVQHAHQKGIVHRDLKPANILVTLYDGKPVPKVIDFGVAKAVAGKLTDASLSTDFGAFIGTLEYMAPEQAGLSALDIDTRADIYSLGVILYEQLTGLRPFPAKRLRKAALDETIRMIREEEPPTPSLRLSNAKNLPTVAALRQTEPKRLTALVRGELDCIVMKALEKDRNRRFETAYGFGRDIERYLADEPIEARPPSMRYRLGKFVKRNRVAVLATAAIVGLLLVSLFTGTAGILWHKKVMADQAAADAKREAEETRKHAAAERKQALNEQSIGSAVEQAEKGRDELQKMLRKPGGVFALLNDQSRWQAKLQSAQAPLDRAKLLLANLDAPPKPDHVVRIRRLADGLSQDETDRKLAVRLDRIQLDDFANQDPKQARINIVSHGKMTALDTDRATPQIGRPNVARDYRNALSDARIFVVTENAESLSNRIRSSAIKELLVAALDDWAIEANDVGDHDTRDKLLQAAKSADPDPKWGDGFRDSSVWRSRESLLELVKRSPKATLSPQMLRVVGTLLARQNAMKENEAWLRDAQARFPGDFNLNVSLASALLFSKKSEAEGFLRTAIALRPDDGRPYVTLGSVLEALNRPNEAMAAYENAVAHGLGGGSAYANIGRLLASQNRMAEAFAAYKKATDLDPTNPVVFYSLGVAYERRKQHDQAVKAFNQAIALAPNYAMAYDGLGVSLDEQKRLREAVSAYKSAIRCDPTYSPVYMHLAGACREQDRLDEAVAALKKLVEFAPTAAAPHLYLGDTLRLKGRLDEAIPCFRTAIRLRPDYAEACWHLGAALLDKGSLSEAESLAKKAIDLSSGKGPVAAGAQEVFARARASLRAEKQLPLVLEGKLDPGPTDSLILGALCYFIHKRYATSSRQYVRAFDARAGLTEAAIKQHRYLAASAAALAGCGRGDEAAALKDDEKAAFRKLALDWLNAELESYRRDLKSRDSFVALDLIVRISQWRDDADFIGVRDATELDKLPSDERKAWQNLWADVQRFRKDAESLSTAARTEQSLDEKNLSRTHKIEMIAGDIYVIEMESQAFDAYLSLEDAEGRLLAANNDIGPTNRNSRIVFQPKESGTCRIVATSLQGSATGPYTLTIRKGERKK